jgi:hypothetical protein
MADGVDASPEDVGLTTNTAIASLPTFESCFYEEITAAFAAWSAVSDINFLPSTDFGEDYDAIGFSGDIRIGAHEFDGASGVLAHGFFPPPNGVSIAGDLHFDIAEEWHCDPNLGGIDIGFVALHEIGHSIGLGHEMTDTAVMNPTYNPALVGGLAADDIIGAGEIYGGTPIADGFFFGNVGVGTDSPDGPIHVFKTDGTAQIVVEDTGTEATLTTLHMKNNGRVQAVYENTDSGLTWQLSQHLTGFIISLVGTGGSEFRVLNDGGVQMGPGPSITFDLDAAGNLTIGGNLTELSDRDQKENIVPVDPQELLERVAELPIAEWSRKGDESATRHVGPMAQDFYESFGLGTDERHLAAVDTSGIALGAIQGLHEQLQRKEAELLDQKQQIEMLRSELAEIKAMLSGSQ